MDYFYEQETKCLVYRLFQTEQIHDRSSYFTFTPPNIRQEQFLIKYHFRLPLIYPIDVFTFTHIKWNVTSIPFSKCSVASSTERAESFCCAGRCGQRETGGKKRSSLCWSMWSLCFFNLWSVLIWYLNWMVHHRYYFWNQIFVSFSGWLTCFPRGLYTSQKTKLCELCPLK